jgi:hypothetical protein
MTKRIAYTLLTAGAFGLLLSSASAQEDTKEEQARKWGEEGIKRTEVTRYAPSGANRTLYFAAEVNPDCSQAGEIEVRVSKKPEHGTVEATPGEGFPNYVKDAIRFKCNAKKVRGVNVIYKSSAGYTGADDFEVVIFSPTGFAWEMHYHMIVR